VLDKELIELLGKMLNIEGGRRPEVSEILLTDPWVRGHFYDQEEHERKI